MRLFRKLAPAFSLILMTLLVLPVVALAYDPIDPKGEICNDPQNATSAACVSKSPDKNPISGEGGIILKIVDIVSYIAGAAAIIVIIYSGIKLATSRGDAQKISNARGTLQDALVGLVIIALSNALISFFVSRL